MYVTSPRPVEAEYFPHRSFQIRQEAVRKNSGARYRNRRLSNHKKKSGMTVG